MVVLILPDTAGRAVIAEDQLRMEEKWGAELVKSPMTSTDNTREHSPWLPGMHLGKEREQSGAP